jgi:hypothetical protein
MKRDVRVTDETTSPFSPLDQRYKRFVEAHCVTHKQQLLRIPENSSMIFCNLHQDRRGNQDQKEVA